MKKTIRYVGCTMRDCYRAYPLFFVVCFIMFPVMMITGIMQPFLLAGIVELAEAPGTETEALVRAILLFGICLVLSPVVKEIGNCVVDMTKVYGQKYFGNQLFTFSKKIRLEELENPQTLERFQKADITVQQEGSQFAFLYMIFEVANNVFSDIGAILVVGRYSPILVVSGLLGILPTVVIQCYSQKLRTALRRRQSNLRRKCVYLWSLFSSKESVKEMRVMGFEKYLIEKWEEVNTSRVREQRDVELDVNKKSVVGIMIQNIFYVLNIGVSFYLMIRGEISVGEFAACLSAFAIYQANLVAIVGNATETAYYYHIVEDYYDYFTVPTEVTGDKIYQPFEGEIVAENVHFRYSGSDRDALSGLSCRIKKGEHVVIVGENGSGKTTFSKLLTGAYLPSSGLISYDGQRTEELSRESFYKHISLVSQDFGRYRFTLRENIGMGDLARMEDTKDMETLLSRVAGAEFLEKTGGLDVQLGREFGGQELSGGEWQKVAIARGLWKESDIIILDEPTSALDPLVEYDILSQFVEMIQDKTSVIISHRVGICRSADKIIVMKEGRMAECGRHEQLLEAGGEYARIWQEQAKWYA